MTILITGDSWSVGEHVNTSISTELNSNGLAECFANNGYSVINIGVNGSSNSLIASNLGFFLDKNRHINFSKVFVFQTEFSRCLQSSTQINADLETLQNKFISQFYKNLSEVSQRFKCKIYLIGGCSDTLWLENFENEYPGVTVACQSLTNFLLTENHRIDFPVFDMYNHPTFSFIELVKKHSNLPQSNFLLSSIDNAIVRRKQFDANPHWFWPDGKHPNQVAFNKLYSFLQDNVYELDKK